MQEGLGFGFCLSGCDWVMSDIVIADDSAGSSARNGDWFVEFIEAVIGTRIILNAEQIRPF